jgi:hypothetical protein
MLFLVALAAAGAAPSIIAPARGSADFDVQCMIVTEQASQSDKLDAATKGQLGLAIMFYFGRVDSALAGNALKERIRANGKRLEGQNLAPVLKTCGEFMTERGSTMQAMGAALEAESKAAPAK